MIRAVLINHNTSSFTELALRSFDALHPDRSAVRLVILDNASTDGTEKLRQTAADLGVELRQSGLCAEKLQVNCHGEVLRRFVLDEPDCDYYFLVDTDICFLVAGTLDRMLAEIESRDDVWAIQARYGADHRILSGGDGRVREHDLAAEAAADRCPAYLHSFLDSQGVPRAADVEGPLSTIAGSVMPRCHPFCTLIRNSPVFRRVTERIGFSCAWILENSADRAGSYDTMALLSAVMATHQQTYLSSSCGVLHFGGASYRRQSREKVVKLQQCRHLLEMFRRGDVPDFTRQDWLLPEYVELIARWRSRLRREGQG